jgi:hypothetical protein
MAPALRRALQQLLGACRWTVAAGIIGAVLTGATAARIALGSPLEGPVNFFWLLGGILGAHFITLLIWLIALLIAPSKVATGSLGRGAYALGQRINHWLHKGSITLTVIQASGLVLVRSALGRWLFSAITHSLWLGFLSGSLALVLLILSTQQYSFVWETTILSDRTYVLLTRTLASLPETLGFMTPDEQQIIASHWTWQGQFPSESSEAWSGLLIGSIVTYGLLPRALLLVLSLGMAWRAGRQFRLDMSLPGYSRLRARLLPEAQLIGVIDAETTPAGEEGEAIDEGRLLPIVVQGPTAILGFEIKPPKSLWPPQLKGVEWFNLGFVDSRDDRQRALQQILAAANLPRLIVVVCSLAATPDRGARAFISHLQKASRIPIVIVLTEGQRLRSRGYDEKQLGERIEDWQQLAKAAHIPPGRVITVDLEHLTTVSLAKFASLLGVSGQEISFEQRLDRSFGLIMEHVKGWSGEPPSVGERAELHRAIAALYRDEQQSWQTLLNIRLKRSGDQLQQLKTSAERVVNLLPLRLRANPRWLAAGAMAGALGCVAAATLVTPAAIATLPAWAGLGAAIAAIVQFPKRSAAKPAAVDLTDAVRSAALFALLLELQGHDEIAITRLIDRVAGDDDSVLDNAETVWQWLTALRQRFDLALAAEGAV